LSFANQAIGFGRFAMISTLQEGFDGPGARQNQIPPLNFLRKLAQLSNGQHQGSHLD
jgi:hypothetical protein